MRFINVVVTVLTTGVAALGTATHSIAAATRKGAPGRCTPTKACNRVSYVTANA